MFSSDKPIFNKKSDKLNRTEFSKQLAKAILSYTETDNFTIGLSGRWGSGKTSIINMVVEEIDELTKETNRDEKPIIVKFNPWNYSDQAELTTLFFKTITTSLGQADNSKTLKDIGTALQNYSELFEYATYIPVAGKYIRLGKHIFSGLGKSLSKKGDKDSSLENRKNNVEKALKAQKQKIIVIIDDIDRLTNSKIKLIFQLVNSLAGFPNMIYLLSFDKDVVVRALSEEQNCNGEEYLEKIIQVPFEIPEANKKLITDVFCEKVDEIILQNAEQNISFDIEYWRNIFPSCISPFIKTMRDVNRVINTFYFKFELMKNETNLTDLLAITTLQVCAANIYEWIFSHANSLTGSVISAGRISGVEQKENKSEYLKTFSIIHKDNPELMLKIVQSLFPSFAWHTGGRVYDYSDNLKLKRNQRIASVDRVFRYFNLSLEEISVSRNELKCTITDYSEDEIDDLLQSLSKSGALYDYLNELEALISEIPQNRQLLFINKFIKIRLNKNSREHKSFLSPTIDDKAKYCIFKIFENNNKSENANIITNLLDSITFDTLQYLCEIIIKIEFAYGRIGSHTETSYQFIELDSLTVIEAMLLSKILSISKERCLFDSTGIHRIYCIWKFLDKKSLSEYMYRILKSSENIPKYLYMIASYWQSSDLKNGWNFDEKSFEYIGKDEAYRKISSLKNTKEFSNLNIRFKQITVAYFLWYTESKDEVLEEEVNLIIPLWEYK